MGVAKGQTYLVRRIRAEFQGSWGLESKLPPQLFIDFLGITEDVDIWWGLKVLLPFRKDHIHYTSTFAESNAMNVHPPKNT